MAIVFLAFGGAHDPAYNPSIVNISPKSFDKAKEFYTPLFNSHDNNKCSLDIL